MNETYLSFLNILNKYVTEEKRVKIKLNTNFYLGCIITFVFKDCIQVIDENSKYTIPLDKIVYIRED